MPGRPQHSDATHAIGEMHETRGPLTREDQAKLEIGRTDVPRWLAVAITLAFLLVILAVPTLQTLREVSGGVGTRATDVMEIVDKARDGWRFTKAGPYDKLFAANAEALAEINDFEDGLEDASWLTRMLLRPVTAFQVRYFGVGNEEAYIGNDGWLFYRPDVDHVMGPGFLEADQLARRASGGNEYTAPPQPDPRKAIVQFRDQLAERGIELIVMPVPVKPSIAPGRFTPRYGGSEAFVRNESFVQFIDDLHAADVTVFNPADLLTGKETYLATDTHWTPQAMQRVAAELAKQLALFSRDPQRSAGERAATMVEVTNLGDIAAMLELPDDQTIFRGRTVTIRQVPDARSADSSILLLGDSFTNIYAMEDLGWGTDAGLAEQLAYELGEPIDVIAINAGGAHAARQALVAEKARGNDRLAGKKVVIWQFAARELSFGDWKLMALPEVQAAEPREDAATAGQTVVTATIVAKTDAPRPGSVPYRDAIISIKLTDIEGGNIAGDIVVYTWGLRDNKLVDGPWHVGKTVKVTLTHWAEAESKYGSYNRFELDDPDALFLDAYWGEVNE